MMRRWLYRCFERYKFPSLEAYYRFLLESDFWPLERLQEYQLAKCRDFLQFAYSYSPYYRRLFDDIGFSPAGMTSLDDLKKIPVLEKPVLQASMDTIQSTYPFGRLYRSGTSGSATGRPMAFYRNEEWLSHHQAAMYRGHSWYGLERWDRNGLLWGYNIDPKKRWRMRLFDFFMGSHRLFSYKRDDVERFVRKLDKDVYLQGYSSMIYEVAKRMNREGRKPKFDLKMIKGTAEKIYESYKAETLRAFGRPMVSEYGSAEAGIIAFECPCGQMHINMEGVVVEEENGEIIVTNLTSKSLPIIRYRLGDAVVLADPDYRCPCGRQHPVLLEVTGRIGDVIYGKQFTYPALTLGYVFKNLFVSHRLGLHYQGVQSRKGALDIRLEQSDTGYEPLLRAELEKYFGDDVEVQILYAQELHDGAGKLKGFVSKMDIKA